MAGGNLLMEQCSACGAAFPEGAKFCAQCGARAQRSDHAPVATPPPQARTERRILTLMFADIVDSTGLADRLGLEDYHAVLRNFHAITQRIVTSRDGTVIQHYGDGVLAGFGLVAEAEDAALCALSTALMLASADNQPHASARIRVGLHSGPVLCVTDADDRLTPEVTGLDLNLASRVAGAAKPGTVMASDTVLRAAGRIVQVIADPVEEHALRGIRTPTPLARVRGIGALAAPVRVRVADREAVAQTIVSGHHKGLPCRAILVTGEAGLGKSALRGEVLSRTGPATHRILIDARASLLRSPLYPLAAWLRQWAEATPTVVLPSPLQEIIAPRPSAPPADGTTANARRLKRIGAMADFILAQMRSRPTALHFDDFHWADEDSAEVIAQVLRTGVPEGSRVVLYARPTAGLDALRDIPGLLTLPLSPLSQSAARDLVMRGTATHLSAEDCDRIVDRAGGNPLYLMALADAARRAGGNLPDSLPATVEASLQANIAALGPDRHLLQTASILGQTVGRQLLTALCPGTSAERLARKIAKLRAARLLDPDRDGTTLAFAHPMLRDAAYAMLPSSQRRALHKSAAELMMTDHPDICAAHPEWIADHAIHSKETALIVPSTVTAGIKFLTDAHFELACRYLAAARDAVAAAKTPAEKETRIQVLTLLCSAQVQRLGFAHPEVAEGYERLDAALDPDAAPSGARLRALYGLLAHRMIGGHVRACKPMVQRMGLAADPGDPQDRILHLVNVTAQHLYAGRFDAALCAAADIESLYDAARDGALILEVGADPLAAAQSARCHILGRRGDLSGAQAVLDDSLAHLNRIGGRAQEPWLRVMFGQAVLTKGETEAARRELASALGLAERQGADFWCLVSRIWAAHVDLRDPATAEAAAAEMQALLAASKGVGVGLSLPIHTTALARHSLSRGDLPAARRWSKDAVRRVALTGEGYWAVEAWHVRARVLGTASGTDAAAGPDDERSFSNSGGPRPQSFPSAARAMAIAQAYARRSGIAVPAD